MLPSSCHPKQTTKAIPFSLGLRIIRICSDKEDRDKRLLELRDYLISRDYSRDMVESAIKKARAVPRDKALMEVIRSKNKKRPVLSITYDPRLPALNATQAKHWRAMVNDNYMKEIFPQPPLTAYTRRNKNIRSHLIRANVTNCTQRQNIFKGHAETWRPMYRMHLYNRRKENQDKQCRLEFEQKF